MNILYITTVSGMMDFFVEQIRILVSNGHSVDFACNSSQTRINPAYKEMGCKHYELNCSRNLNPVNILNTVSQIEGIVKSNNYDIVHCHSPIASFCTRIACRKYRKKGLSVIYTAHGFHFYRNAPFKNWLLFYPPEKICAKWTDFLITINTDDYKLALSKLKAKHIRYVPGVGINLCRFDTKNNNSYIRKSLKINDSDFVMLTIGELNENKNQSLIINAISELGLDNIHYLIVGNGAKKDELINLSKIKSVDKQVHILGYRNDVEQLLDESDVFVFPSLREGLSVSIMESMGSAKPVICSDIRGNRDLIVNEKGGFLCRPNDVHEFKNAIMNLYNNRNLLEQMGLYNKERAKLFSEDAVFSKIDEIYSQAYSPNI